MKVFEILIILLFPYISYAFAIDKCNEFKIDEKEKYLNLYVGDSIKNDLIYVKNNQKLCELKLEDYLGLIKKTNNNNSLQYEGIKYDFYFNDIYVNDKEITDLKYSIRQNKNHHFPETGLTLMNIRYVNKPVSVLKNIICFKSDRYYNQYINKNKPDKLIGDSGLNVTDDCRDSITNEPIQFENYIDKESYLASFKSDPWVNKYINKSFDEESKSKLDKEMDFNKYFNLLSEMDSDCYFGKINEFVFYRLIIVGYNKNENKLYLRKTLQPFKPSTKEMDYGCPSSEQKITLGLKVKPTEEFRKKLEDAMSKNEVKFFN